MKKKVIERTVILTVIMAVILTGCSSTVGRKATDASEDDEEIEEVAEEEEEKEKEEETKKTKKDKESYTLEVPYDNGDRTYTSVYILEINDDKNATLTEKTVPDTTREFISIYRGVYSKKNYGYEFSYIADGEDGSNIIYKCYMDNGVMTEVVSDNIGAAELAGIYTGYSDEYGYLILTLNRDASATLATDVGDFTGYISKYQGRWELMAYNDYIGESVDWYIYFSDATFAYKEYYAETYRSYAGTFKADGMLGVLEFYLTDDGRAYTNIDLDGHSVGMYGYYYVDVAAREVYQITLNSDEGYSLYLNVKEIGEMYPNYSGTISYPLGAG